VTQTREQLLATIRERMVAYASSHLGRDFAEDLAQETLLVLEQKYGDKDRPEDLLPIAFQVLRFKLTEFRRKATRRGEWDTEPVDELPLADSRADQAVDLERRELQARLEAAIEKLDGRCRDLFRLKLEDRTFEEIRQIMNAAAINTVYTWDHRCRQRLLQILSQEDAR
jgi:RNA polymerase sigma-70 factor (ECF subfamily)